MIFQASKHRQFVKLENIILGIEDIFPRVPIVDNSYPAYQNVLNEGRDLLFKTARDFTKSLDTKINYIINAIIDRAQFGNYQDVEYAEVKYNDVSHGEILDLKTKKVDFENNAKEIKINSEIKIKGESKLKINDYANLINETPLNFYKVKEVINGEFVNSQSIKDKKPKRLWKWKDRLEYVEGFFKDYKMNDDEKESLKETYDKLKKNYYLKKKHSDIYEAISKYISS